MAAWYWRSSTAVLAALAIATLIVTFPLFKRLRIIDSSGPLRCDIAVLKAGMGYGIRAYLLAALGFLVLRVNSIILENFVSAAELGTWSVAAQIIETLTMIPATMALLLFPKLLKSATPIEMLKESLRNAAALMLILAAMTAYLGPMLISIMFGERFFEAYHMVLWGLPGAVALGLISILSQYLAAERFPSPLILIWISAVAVETASSLYLIPALGGRGAMMAMSISYLFLLISISFLVLATAKRREPIKPIL